MASTAKQAGNTGTGFLTFNSKPPKIYMTSEDPDFDPLTIKQWQSEGFSTTYLPYTGDLRAFKATLMSLGDDLALGEHYALVAYESAATAALEACVKPHHHMVALIAYYPTRLPAAKTTFPRQTEYLLHLTAGYETTLRSYVYPDVQPGFAEADLDEYDRVAADLSWSRTIGTVKKAFKIEVDLEPLWDEYLGLEFYRREARAALATMVDDKPIVNHVPTLTGGVGKQELLRFYEDHFVKQNPASMRIRLVSRTIGADRVVDEMVVSFRHEQRMDWLVLLPFCCPILTLRFA